MPPAPTPPHHSGDAPIPESGAAPLGDRVGAALEPLKNGDFRTAGVLAQSLIQDYPDRPAGYRIMAQISNFRGDQPSAIRWIDQAISRNPRNVQLKISRSQFCHDAGRVQEAIDILETITIDGPFADKVKWRHIMSLERLGRIDEAAALLEEIPHPLPPAMEAFRSQLEYRQGHIEAARHRLERLLSQSSTPTRVRGEGLFQLSRLCDAMGNYDAAFQAAATANIEFRGDFDPAAFESSTETMIEYFTPERFESLPRSNVDSDLPVFIIGLPRSGTSLLEQIIDAHPKAAGSGERRDPILISEDLTHVLGGSFPSCLDSVTEATLSAAGGQYVHMLTSYGFGVSRIVNKSLSLDRIAGLLPLLTPRCRVIFMSRNPLDNLLSIFLHPLRRDRNPWAQSLDDLCVVRQSFDRLREHWLNVLPCPCLDVSYEQLVHDQQNTTEEVLRFLDLPWNDACMSFHNSKRAVMTPSYDQVNTSMNTNAINRWKNYEQHIGPLLHAFPPDLQSQP
ncbi:MAG: hypothetical protein GY894_10095 [Planctomycetes bacterium]|nr:hypothetical protein [Planctomycetota bacterium]MCP4839691.1 hypothetical protein [Planctomycetota bacterium]